MEKALLISTYASEVLGWKPRPPRPSKSAALAAATESPLEISHKKTFGIYSPDLGRHKGDALILSNMLKAIGQTQYEVLEEDADLDSYIHILNFSGEALESAEAKIWDFRPLEEYLGNPSEDLNQKKREAWNRLKAFQKEAF